MATLFDALQQRLTNPETQAPQPQQGQIAAVLRAKGGKAGGGTAPAASSLGESAAIGAATPSPIPGALAASQVAGAAQEQQANTQLAEQSLASQQRIAESGLTARATGTREQLASTQQLAADQRASQESMKAASINSNATNQLRTMSTQKGVALDNIFSDFKRSNQELEFRSDAAALEQLGFQLAMSDRAYLDELQRVGRERELYDNLKFQNEMNDVVLGDNLKTAMDNLQFEKAFNSDARMWEKQLTEMGADAKMDLARAMVADEQKRAVVTGLGSAAGAGASAYATSKPTTTKPAAPANAGTTQFHGGPGGPDYTGRGGV